MIGEQPRLHTPGLLIVIVIRGSEKFKPFKHWLKKIHILTDNCGWRTHKFTRSCQSVCLSVGVSFCLYGCLSVCLSVCLYFSFFVCMSVRVSAVCLWKKISTVFCSMWNTFKKKFAERKKQPNNYNFTFLLPKCNLDGFFFGGGARVVGQPSHFLRWFFCLKLFVRLKEATKQTFCSLLISHLLFIVN